MEQIIRKAIQERRVLSFQYKGEPRMVEPHTFGRQKSGGDALCAWQVAGGTGEGYRLFLAAQIGGLTLEHSETFDVRPGYHRGDRRFDLIYAEL